MNDWGCTPRAPSFASGHRHARAGLPLRAACGATVEQRDAASLQTLPNLVRPSVVLGLPRLDGVGGHGGNVYVRASDKIESLHEVRRKNKSQRYLAESGECST